MDSINKLVTDIPTFVGETVVVGSASHPPRAMVVADVVESKTALIGGVNGFKYKGVSVEGGLPIDGGTTLQMKEDGTKIWISNSSTDVISEFGLAVPFDISTIDVNYSKNIKVTSPESALTCFRIAASGTKLFIAGTTTDKITQYTMSTAWDVSTAVNDGLSLDPAESAITHIDFSADGTKVFFTGSTADRIESYSLATPWDLTGATNDNVGFHALDTIPGAFAFEGNGKVLYIAGESADSLFEFRLGNAWDLNSAIYVGYKTLRNVITGYSTVLTSLSLPKDGTMIVLDSVKDLMKFEKDTTVYEVDTTSVTAGEKPTVAFKQDTVLEIDCGAGFEKAENETVLVKSVNGSTISVTGSFDDYTPNISGRELQLRMKTATDINVTRIAGSVKKLS